MTKSEIVYGIFSLAQKDTDNILKEWRTNELSIFRRKIEAEEEINRYQGIFPKAMLEIRPITITYEVKNENNS